MSGLDGALLAALDGHRVDVRELVIREEGRPFVSASGEVDLEGDIALTVRGDGIPGPLLGGGVDSRFDLTLGLGGRTDSPTLDARLESSEGTFLKIGYDEFVARVTGAEGVVRVEPLALERGVDLRRPHPPDGLSLLLERGQRDRAIADVLVGLELHLLVLGEDGGDLDGAEAACDRAIV